MRKEIGIEEDKKQIPTEKPTNLSQKMDSNPHL
jgi:hypothetical protein